MSTSLKLQPAAAARVALTLYLTALEKSPISTKIKASGLLYFLSELVSSAVAGKSAPTSVRAARELEKEDKTAWNAANPLTLFEKYKGALKLAAYGGLVAAPLDHFLFTLLERVFAGQQGKHWRVLEVVAAQTAILPIQNAVYLVVLSIIGGAKSANAVWSDLKGGFVDVMKLTSVISTLSLVFAQRFLPPHLYTPFFSLITVVVDTSINIGEKKRVIVDAEKKRLKAEVEGKDE